MNKYKRPKWQRSSRGVSALEVAIAAFSMIAMIAIGLDATIFIMAYSRLDQTARDAARAAGGQPKSSTDPLYPSTVCAAALKAAQSQCTQHYADGTFIKQPYLTGTTAPNFVYQDYGGNTPANLSQSPYVVVTVSQQVVLPIPINFFGFNSNTVITGNMLTFTRRYVFPIVKTKSYTSPTGG